MFLSSLLRLCVIKRRIIHWMYYISKIKIHLPRFGRPYSCDIGAHIKLLLSLGALVLCCHALKERKSYCRILVLYFCIFSRPLLPIFDKIESDLKQSRSFQSLTSKKKKISCQHFGVIFLQFFSFHVPCYPFLTKLTAT